MTSLVSLDSGTTKGPDAACVRAALDAEGMALRMNTDGQLDLTTVRQVAGRGVRTVVNADSMAATDAISTAVLVATGKPASANLLEAVKAQVRHEARQEGCTTPVYLRIAFVGDVAYVALRPGRVACITRRGWGVVDDLAPGVPLFRRGAGTGEQPDPVESESATGALRFVLGILQGKFGLTPAQALAVLAAVLEWHRTGTPHPILELVGAAGSGKSTLADWLLSLVDPAGDGRRITVGTAGPDIAAAAQQRYVMVIDNAGKFDKATSDMLCVLSTGGTLLVRLLYTNGETASLNLHRPLIVTAVSPVCTAPDLQSRTVRVEMPPRQGDMTPEDVLRADLDARKPKVLSALYTLLSGALRELPTVRARGGWAHRLVDLDQMGEAMLAAVGVPPGRFQAAINQLRGRAARRTASGDLFVLAVMEALRKLANKPTHEAQPTLNAVMNSPTQLAVIAYGQAGESIEVTIRPKALRQELVRQPRSFGRDDPIPATERGLTDALRRVQPLLKDMGITATELQFGSRGLIRFDFNRDALSDV